MSEKEIKIESVEEQVETVDATPDQKPDQEPKVAPNEMFVFPWSWEEATNLKYADLHVWCRNCGADTALEHPGMKNMQTAMHIDPMPTTNKAFLAMSCPKCNTQVVLHFRDAANPPTPEEEAEMEKARLEERERMLAAQEAAKKQASIDPTDDVTVEEEK